MLWQSPASISPGDRPVQQLPTAPVPPLPGFALPCGSDSSLPFALQTPAPHLWKHLMIQEPAAPWGWFPLPPEFLPPSAAACTEIPGELS